MEKMFQVTILGCAAATPTSVRHTTAQVLQYHNKLFLLDCAEGAQIQMRKFRLPMMRVNHIFISHLHGDHYLGLPGLLFSYHLLGRDRELHIYSPPGIKEIIDVHFRVAGFELAYQVVYHDLSRGGEIIYQDKYLCVETLEMDHRIPTFGFLFREKPMLRNIRKNKIQEYSIPWENINQIKAGADFSDAKGNIIPNEELTIKPAASRAYAFCSDTAYTEKFLEQINQVDLLYHEATFLKKAGSMAREKTHSTTVEAALIAKKANARQLLLGHYSARYDDMNLFLEEASEVFPNTILAEEGKVILISLNHNPPLPKT
jgi:ribonuclease Z